MVPIQVLESGKLGYTVGILNPEYIDDVMKHDVGIVELRVIGPPVSLDYLIAAKR